jgi:hypothetical protein
VFLGCLAEKPTRAELFVRSQFADSQWDGEQYLDTQPLPETEEEGNSNPDSDKEDDEDSDVVQETCA